jgi:hypothetical protein
MCSSTGSLRPVPVGARPGRPLATLWPVLRRPLIVLALVGAIAASSVAPAFAASSPAVSDCSAHGRLTQRYSVAELRTALATMPADVQEYTNCYNVIQNQMLDQIPGHHTTASSSGGSGSSFLSTPLLVALIVVLAGGGALAGVALQRRGGPPVEE